MTDPQKAVLDAAAEQIISDVLAEVTGAEARETARRRLMGRIEFFMTGMRQIGFSAWLDTEPGGLLKVTIDPNSWEAPIPGPSRETEEPGQ